MLVTRTSYVYYTRDHILKQTNERSYLIFPLCQYSFTDRPMDSFVLTKILPMSYSLNFRIRSIWICTVVYSKCNTCIIVKMIGDLCAWW